MYTLDRKPDEPRKLKPWDACVHRYAREDPILRNLKAAEASLAAADAAGVRFHFTKTNM
jgi:hypothetical protein